MSRAAKRARRDVLTRVGYGDGVFFNNPVNNNVAMVESIYLRRFTELCANRFEWKGLPDSVSERYLELTLIRNAVSVFFYDEKYQKYLALPGGSHGYNDMMDEPTRFNVTGNTMYNKIILASDCVPIWANRARHPDNDIMLWYARRLAEVETTVDINVKSARLSRILAVSENMRLTGENLIRQIDEGNPVIKVDQGMLDDGLLSTLDMGVNPDQILSVQMVKNRLFNDCMTFLGVNNSNQDKKERLVSDEVDANEEQVLLNRAIALGVRKTAAKLINEKYPELNVSVDWNSELKGRDESVVNHGDVYDDAEGNSGE